MKAQRRVLCSMLAGAMFAQPVLAQATLNQSGSDRELVLREIVDAISMGNRDLFLKHVTSLVWYKITHDPNGPTAIDPTFLFEQVAGCEKIIVTSMAAFKSLHSRSKMNVKCSNRKPIEKCASSDLDIEIRENLDGSVEVDFLEGRSNVSPCRFVTPPPVVSMPTVRQN